MNDSPFKNTKIYSKADEEKKTYSIREHSSISKNTKQEKIPPGIPSISLPKGGGAIRGIGEKFNINPVTGTGSITVPIYTSPGRSGFGPQLALSQLWFR